MDGEKEDDPDPEGPTKRTFPSNYKSLTCLPIILKTLIARIREIFYSLVFCGLFSEEQKRCCSGTKGTNIPQYTDQYML